MIECYYFKSTQYKIYAIQFKNTISVFDWKLYQVESPRFVKKKIESSRFEAIIVRCVWKNALITVSPHLANQTCN